MDQALVLYDRDCGFCTWSAELLRRWDGDRGMLRFAPLQSQEAEPHLGGMDPAVRAASWHLVADGQVVSAGAAIPPVLRRLRGGGPLAWVAQRLPRTTEVAYRHVASRRDRLGAMLGRQACSVDPSRPRAT